MKKSNYVVQLAAGAALLGFATVPVHVQPAGETRYKTKCAACHGADGRGETAIGKTNKLRDLGSADVQKQSDAELTGIIMNGRNKMPGHGKSLKPEQIKELVGHIRTLGKN